MNNILTAEDFELNIRKGMKGYLNYINEHKDSITKLEISNFRSICEDFISRLSSFENSSDAKEIVVTTTINKSLNSRMEDLHNSKPLIELCKSIEGDLKQISKASIFEEVGGTMNAVDMMAVLRTTKLCESVLNKFVSFKNITGYTYDEDSEYTNRTKYLKGNVEEGISNYYNALVTVFNAIGGGDDLDSSALECLECEKALGVCRV